jgi:protein-S-isoprenylcysteine O-methyltransferase Ste14
MAHPNDGQGTKFIISIKASLGLLFLAIIMSLLLFFPAGTVRYWQAWGFLALFLGVSTLITLYLMARDPALLKRRLRGGWTAEKEKTQKVIWLFVSIGFAALLVVPALDHRYRWSNMSSYMVIAGYVLTALGFSIMFLVLKENPFTSTTIEIAEDQKVISTGPYAFVRHPYYAGALLLLIGMPLALGSY